MTKKKQHLFNTYTFRTASKVAGLLKRKKCYSFQPVAIFACHPKHSPTPLLAVRTSGNFKKDFVLSRLLSTNWTTE